MSEFNKMCLALVSVGLLLGCAAFLEERQQTPRIQCTDGAYTLYTGPYIEESWNGYLVHVDNMTHAFYPKGLSRKVPA